MNVLKANNNSWWCETSLGDICSIVTGDKDVNEGDESGTYPFFTCAKHISMFGSYSFEGDALLIAGNGNFSVKKYSGQFEAYQRTYVLQNFKIDYLYLYYFISFKLSDITKDNRGSTIRYIRIGDLTDYSIQFPSFNEQHRIVDKIEELFSELDKGIESLKTAQEQLKVYRQALLKHAFEGKLTEQWRNENADKLETADQLLSRIQQERETRYQQQLEKWKKEFKKWESDNNEGKKPIKPAKIKSMDAIVNDELDSLPKIPVGWLWVRYGGLCSVVRNGISKKPIGDKGEKIFRISAVRSMYFNMSDFRIIDNSTGEFDNYFLLENDLVFTRYNGSRRYVGVCAAYQSKEKRLFPDKLVQTRPDLPVLSTSYLEKALNSAGSRKFVETKIRTTAGQSGVSGSDIKNIPVPVCSQAEQIEISNYLETNLSILDDNVKIVNDGLAKSEALRQSILKKAFSGQLVPQNPNDEPTTELLNRIAIEKSEMEEKIKAAKKAVKKTRPKVRKKATLKNKISKKAA